MKVVGIIGSLRKDSLHRKIFNHYTELAQGSFELIEGEIADIPMYDGEQDDHPALLALGEKIADADGVIFFSPEYNYSIPGSLKNAIDALSRLKPQPFAGKPAAIIGASPGNIGTARMQYHLRQVGVFLDLHFLNKPEVMIGGAFGKVKDGVIIDEPTIEFLTMHAKTFADFINQEKGAE
jgi:chromate reductase